MGTGLLITTVVGLIASAGLVIVSLHSGRRAPVHRVPWIIAIVALSVSILFRVALFIGTAINGSLLGSLPILLGNLAVGGALVAAFWQPRWTGWTLMGSALVLPALNWILETLLGSEWTTPALAFFAIPALVTGELLVLSMKSKRVNHQQPDAVPDVPVVVPG